MGQEIRGEIRQAGGGDAGKGSVFRPRFVYCLSFHWSFH